MLPRCFIYLCMIALFIAVASIRAEEMDSSEVEDRANPAVTVVAKLLGKLFAGAAASCLTEAASACKSHWKHPTEAFQCGKDWLANNKGKCAVGK